MTPQRAEVPLMRASVLSPFIDRLTRTDRNVIFDRLEMTSADLASDSHLIAAETSYRVVEWCADLSGNKYFGLEAGLALSVEDWPPFRDAAGSSVTLVEFLSKFSATASRYASSTRYSLEFGAEECIFRQRRTFRPSALPEQADAFAVGLLVILLKRSAGKSWDMNELQLKVCAPEFIDHRALASARKVAGDRMGVSCSFPMGWLWENCDFAQDDLKEARIETEKLPKELERIIEQVIKSGVSVADINGARLAKELGVPARTLRERLRKSGTNLRNVINEVKKTEAERLLVQNSMSVTDAATRLGYNDPANFTRAFKRLTGKSPKHFKRDSVTFQ